MSVKIKRTKSKLSYQLNERLKEMDRIGESKLKSDDGFKVGSAPKTIHSYSTMKNYEKTLNVFFDYCKENGINERSDLDDLLEKKGADFLNDLIEKGRAPSTVQAYRSALNKVVADGIIITVDEIPPIKQDEITNNNTNFSERTNANHFSFENNQNLVNVALGTGARSSEVAKLTRDDFRYENGIMVVDIHEGKHGKSRTSPVLKEYQKDIERFLETKHADEPLFARVHNHAPMHRFRAEYSKKLHVEVVNDIDYKNAVAELYPDRKDNYYESTIQSDKYISKVTDFSGMRDDIHLVTQALGHNRLEVTVTRYLTKSNSALD